MSAVTRKLIAAVQPARWAKESNQAPCLASGPGTGAPSDGLLNAQLGRSDTLTRTLLIVTALLEAATGFALAASPSLLVSLLIGSPLDTRPRFGYRAAGRHRTTYLRLGLLARAERPEEPRDGRPGRGDAVL